jgi:hypothetical protein
MGLSTCGDPAVRTSAGFSTGQAPSPTVASSNFSTRNNDRDNDGDHNDDDEGVLKYGHAADASDWRASVALLDRYYAAAVDDDGARACAQLVPFIAEAVPEDEGSTPGLRGSSCATVMTKLFRRLRRQVAIKHRSMKVIAVRVQGDRALAVIDFSAIPEVREFKERRIGVGWRLLALLDGNLE